MESIHTRLENILDREIESNKRILQLSGSSSPLALGLFLSQTNAKTLNALPHLVIVPDEDIALRLKSSVTFFDPQRTLIVLPEIEASPFSGLYPSPKVTNERLRFLYFAQNAKPGQIFVATVNALSQLVLPFKEFTRHTKVFRAGDTLPDDLPGFFSFLGYQSAPLVEDQGQFSVRGGIIDVFSPGEFFPVRIELFGDQIETLRFFNISDQRNLRETTSLTLIPAQECLYDDEKLEIIVKRFRDSFANRNVDTSESEEIMRSLVLQQSFPGIEFLSSFFYDHLDSAVDYFSDDLNVWSFDPTEISRTNDVLIQTTKEEFESSLDKVVRPSLHRFLRPLDEIQFPENSRRFFISNLDYLNPAFTPEVKIEYKSHSILEFSQISQSFQFGTKEWNESISQKIAKWKADKNRIFVGVKNQTGAEKLKMLLQRLNFNVEIASPDTYRWETWIFQQDRDASLIHIIPRSAPESLRLDEENIIFLRESDFFGRKTRVKESSSEDFQNAARRLNFGDLKPGDLVVHLKHGIGKYEGLKVMLINEIQCEFLQVSYKDSDKLYVPVYKVGSLQKFSGTIQTSILDKLGGTGWTKTKAKVKSALKDIASELLALYAKRADTHRPSFVIDDRDTELFEKQFPYEETDDQVRAINDIIKDLSSNRPMDRLICGDVGFGKTEVAMRAAFFAVQNQKQVAVLAPTTVLTFQHLESFKKRFHGWPIEIRALNRFVSAADAKKTLANLKDGKVDIIIGTHRLLSKDVVFKDLGMLIVDEEQKFGVGHKEKVKKLKASVDTIALSATPIPRTLNMSLMGVRDISLINTAPVDRLPTRTFVTKFNDETVRKAIQAELKRGGQVYFIHNRIQSIFGVADEIRRICPEARIRVAHGQLAEEELEKAMLAFFHHEIDILICTAIVESGMDVPRANTMFIDQAQMFGLSQLYQLRGRVGRSKVRAYCYLLMPAKKKIEKEAQERLKIIQENSSLGSGIKIAQYDLEMRGGGSILSEDQSGHVESVGYELYMDLLAEALAEAQGNPIDDAELDPEVNLRIPALIPESYISDVRLRLGYYKALSSIRNPDELAQLEDEIKEQFGKIPDETINLMGIMLVRLQCKELGVKDVTAGFKAISLIFSERTRMKPQTVIQLAMKENKKYSILPDNRLNIRMNNITWSNVHAEIEYLIKIQT